MDAMYPKLLTIVRARQPITRLTETRLLKVIRARKPIRDHLPIALVLALSFVVNIVGISWGLPNYLDWAVDSIVPFDMLEAVYHRFSRGWANIYPPFAYAVPAALSAPLMAYLVLSGGLSAPTPVFPFGLSDPLFTMTYIILVTRICSALMAVGIVWTIYLTACRIFDRKSAIFAALIVTLYYPFIYYAHNANTDVPYLFWASLAIYYFVGVLQQATLKQYVLFALFGTLAICTKDQAYGLFILSPLVILWARFTEARAIEPGHQNWGHLLSDKRLLTAAVVSVVTFVVAHNLMFNFSGFLEHVRLITGPASQPYADYPPSLWGRFQLLLETVSKLAEGLTLPIFSVCIIGSIYCSFKYPRYSIPLLFLAVSYYLTFINVVRYVPLRFVLPIAIIMALFGGKLLAELWQGGPLKTVRRVAAVSALAYAALFAIQLDLLFLYDPRYAAERWLAQNLKEGAIIETFAIQDSFFKYYPRLPPSVKVRSSKLAAGTDWEIRHIRADRQTIPNLYTGRGDPDYVILPQHWYDRFMRPSAENTPEARVLYDFFQHRTDFRLVASFETPTFVPVTGLRINSRIDIFARPN